MVSSVGNEFDSLVAANTTDEPHEFDSLVPDPNPVPLQYKAPAGMISWADLEITVGRVGGRFDRSTLSSPVQKKNWMA